MSVEQLQQTLSKLAETGTLVKNRRMRQVWRFEHAGMAYYLKFYPRQNSILQKIKKIARGNPAMREFKRLQWLQKANIPAPRAIAVLMGFNIAGTKTTETMVGDAVILQAIEPSVTLDQYFNQYHLIGEVPPDYRNIAEKIRKLVYELGKAGLGHSDLHLGNFLLKDGDVYLLDAYSVRHDGLHKSDVMKLGHSVGRYATVTELLRGWYMLGDGGRLPAENPVSNRIWKTFNNRTIGDGNYFGKIRSAAGWSGVFFSNWKYPHRWASASHLTITEADWQREWPKILEKMNADTLQIIKRGDSGDVMLADITLAGKPVTVVVKRPRRRFWYRYVNELFRGARGKRAWHKTWNLLIRNVPTAWPLLLIEKRVCRYVVDSIIVCQYVPGIELASANLDEIPPDARLRFFQRCGRLLRKIESFDYSHFDAKANNWIVCPDDKAGPIPVLVDIDGIRYRRWVGLGIERLLRSLKLHKQYTPEDSLQLCRGYAPYAVLHNENPDQSEPEKPEDQTEVQPAEVHQTPKLF